MSICSFWPVARNTEQILSGYCQVISVAITTIIMSHDCQYHTMADYFLEAMSKNCFNKNRYSDTCLYYQSQEG